MIDRTSSPPRAADARPKRFLLGHIDRSEAVSVCALYGVDAVEAEPKLDERHNREAVVTAADGKHYLLQELVDPVGGDFTHALWNKFAQACESADRPVAVANLVADAEGRYVREIHGRRYRLLEHFGASVARKRDISPETAYALGEVFGRSQRAARGADISDVPVRDDEHESYWMPTPAHQWAKIRRSLGLPEEGAYAPDPWRGMAEIMTTIPISETREAGAILTSGETIAGLALYCRPRPELTGLSHGNARLPSFIFDEAGMPVGLCNPDSVGIRQLAVDLGQMLRSLCATGDWRRPQTWKFDRVLLRRALAGYNDGLGLDRPLGEREALLGIHALLCYLVLRWGAATIDADDFRPDEWYEDDVRVHHLGNLRYHAHFLREVSSLLAADGH